MKLNRTVFAAGTMAAAVAFAVNVGAGAAKTTAHATSGTTIRVAVVANSNMENIEKLTKQYFTAKTGIKVQYRTLDENDERAQIETDISTHANEYDVVMISNYETPMWAKNGWLVDLSKPFAADKSYDVKDLIKPIAQSLSYKGQLYGAPFYGESSMVYYRKSMLKKAGVTMPLHPTWKQMQTIVAKVSQANPGVAGICLRGQVGWGEDLAPLDTVINTGGGSWFNMKWQPQLTSPATTAAVDMYVNMVRKYGEKGAAQDGFNECESDYGEGKAAMWYDATVAAGLITSTYPSVGKDTGYAYAPTGSASGAAGAPSGWLYTWSLSVPNGDANQAAAEQYIEWATGKQYIAESGPHVGWANIDPGTRYSTYALPQYKKAAAAFADITLKSISAAHPNDPANPGIKVPYTGVQFVDEPWFESLGTEVSNQISAAIAGTESVSQALKTSQADAEATVKQWGLK